MRKYCEEQQISISELVKLAADIVTAAENSVSHLGFTPGQRDFSVRNCVKCCAGKNAALYLSQLDPNF